MSSAATLRVVLRLEVVRALGCLLTTFVVFASNGVAEAAGWSPAASFRLSAETWQGDAGPHVAIAEDGTSVAAWISGDHVIVTNGDSTGRFATPRALGRWFSGLIDVAAGPGGEALVAWEGADGVRASVRPRAGRSWRTRLVARSNGFGGNRVVVARDPLGGWVIVEYQVIRNTARSRIRAVLLRADGSSTGPTQSFGDGYFGAGGRPLSIVGTSASGATTLVYPRDSGTGKPVLPMQLARAEHGGRFGAPQPVASGRRLVDPWLAALPDGRALLAATNPTSCGDPGCSGPPFVWRVDAQGATTPLGGPRLAAPARAFDPSVAPLAGDAAVLVFQLKSAPRPDTTKASVRAVVVAADGSVGPLQTLTDRLAIEPEVLTLPDERALALWSDPHHWGAALADPTGRFRAIPGPPGPPPPTSHHAAGNRDAATGGAWAAVAWSQRHRVRMSIRRF